MEILSKITREQYFEWYSKILEMQLAESKSKELDEKINSMSKDIEIQQLRLAIFKNRQSPAKEKINNSKKEYENYKVQLETNLGISLNGCVIDDITFEVKKLTEE